MVIFRRTSSFILLIYNMAINTPDTQELFSQGFTGVVVRSQGIIRSYMHEGTLVNLQVDSNGIQYYEIEDVRYYLDKIETTDEEIIIDGCRVRIYKLIGSNLFFIHTGQGWVKLVFKDENNRWRIDHSRGYNSLNDLLKKGVAPKSRAGYLEP
jgi:hypothetical protein